ncbi:YsnF/AvaK domain-containing protein [Flaviaesturariibacter amylovorans]|uniref:DUF2382 domain-containing protein n=1 Tax=Flaviaesturariibacter amylovorans TaxID=1084520 RepID=A0ABP8G7Y1_9BACT
MDENKDRIVLGPDGNPVSTHQEQQVGNEQPLQAAASANPGELVIPVIEESMTVDKELVETGKVRVRKIVTAEEHSINMPLIQEYYDVERVPTSKVYEKAPVPRQEGETIIVPVVKEVLVIEKRYEVIEEVRLTRKVSSVPHIQQVTLMKERVEVIRTDADGRNRLE